MKTISLLSALLFICSFVAKSQVNQVSKNNLNRRITARFHQQPLNQVLEKIGLQGNFYFSYSGNIMQRDSIVSLNLQSTPVRDVLDMLFKGNVEYKESGNYIILRSAIYRFVVETKDIENTKNGFEIAGYVYNQRTGEKIKNASVYEKKLLKSTLTDKQGYFKLKFKGESGVVLTVSKEDYRDTSISYLSAVAISPDGYIDGSEYSNRVERFRFARFLMSSRQRVQSLNIPSFIANSPFQASVWPGLSSHGILSSQIVNKGSLNILGGYTAGVDGVEIAGLFNINKKDVKTFQTAGLLNIVGGKVQGFQAAGTFNVVMDSVAGSQVAGVFNNVQNSVEGFQAAGVINRTRQNFKGGQVAGVLNISQGQFKGVQAAGVTNVTFKNHSGPQIAGVNNLALGEVKGTQIAGVLNTGWKSVDGTQIAGVLNIAGKDVNGVQIAGVVNFARKMRGTQVGLINIADTSSGYSIGLLNLIRKGYHKISISNNEVLNTNIAVKTGNANFYTSLIAGANFSSTSKAYSLGIGIGHDFIFNPKLSLALELNEQALFLGSRNGVSALYKLQPLLQYQFYKGITLFSGPVFSVYDGRDASSAEGYKSQIAPAYAKKFFNSDVQRWFGYTLGITFM